MTDTISLFVNGQIFDGWMDIEVHRALDRMASHFQLTVTSQGSAPYGGSLPGLFRPCSVKIGTSTVLTGYVDDVDPEIDDRTHKITVIGRSKTCDLVDCTPDIASGQFRGYTLEQIARAICKPFGIDVIVQTDATQVFPDATLQRSEKAFPFLERLGRLSGVLITDNELGQLVLTSAGSEHATGSLIYGQNIWKGRAKLSGANRFSVYIVKGQHAIGSAAPGWGGAGGIGSASAPTSAPVITNMKASAVDTSVPRYRPRVTMAEAQLDQAGMQRRANWERNFEFGRGTEAEITVKGWRQGGLSDTTARTPVWALNQLVSATVPALGIDQDLLIAGVTFRYNDREGQTTRLKLGPVEGYTPDPGQVKLHTRRGKKGKTAPNWDGAGISD